MSPVEIVELYLHKVPLILVMLREQIVEHSDVSVIRESEVAYSSSLALGEQEVEYAVIHISLGIFGHGIPTSSNCMQQHIVDVIHLQFLQRVAIHRYGCFATACVGSEVGQFGGNEILIAWMATECDARGTL